MTQAGAALDLAFDIRTGVLVRMSGPTGSGGFEVVHLTEHSQLGAELFLWEGPSVDAPMSARRRPSADPERKDTLRVEELTAQIAALGRPEEVIAAIAAAEGGRAAREAIIDLLGVSPFGAEAVASMSLMGFRPDVARRVRAELAALQGRPVDEEP